MPNFKKVRRSKKKERSRCRGFKSHRGHIFKMIKRMLKKIGILKDKDKSKTKFKIRKLKGVAHSAISLDYRDPLKEGFVIKYLPPKIEANLLTHKITPNLKGDDIEKHFKLVFKWFPEVLEKEGIPIKIIEEAKIIVEPGSRPVCVIKAEGRIYSSED